MPSAQITTDQSLEQWPPVCQSDVDSTDRHLAYRKLTLTHWNWPTPVALPKLCNQQDWNRTCWEVTGLTLWWSLASRDEAAWRLCAHTLCRRAVLSKFKLVLCFRLYKEYEIAYGRKFIVVYVCQKLSKTYNVIAKIKWCSFLTHVVVWMSCRLNMAEKKQSCTYQRAKMLDMIRKQFIIRQ